MNSFFHSAIIEYLLHIRQSAGQRGNKVKQYSMAPAFPNLQRLDLKTALKPVTTIEGDKCKMGEVQRVQGV